MHISSLISLCPVAVRLGLVPGLALLLLGSGCATITRGTHEALVIESTPNGAEVRLSNGLAGSTPGSFKVRRKGDIDVTIAKPGYETVTVHVTTQVAKAGALGMAGNVLVGGLIGAGVDAMSGGMLEHRPNPVQVTLVPLVRRETEERTAPAPKAAADAGEPPRASEPEVPPTAGAGG